MKQLIAFNTIEDVDLDLVGGKGYALIYMTRHGLPVPPGVVLTTAFFQPWIEAVKQLPHWMRIIDKKSPISKAQCDALKEEAMQLGWQDEQIKSLAQMVDLLETEREPSLFAVRSSSPEEDLEGASFAGGYETSLGVNKESLEKAIRLSFVSCLDERIFLYKRQHGFDISRSRIAVVVQQQIPSTVSGVAFSLNPLNNCYDEAVINANFGLGESVVSGQVSPDTFIMDKVGRRLIEKQIGAKETAVYLNETGGTDTVEVQNKDEFCLDEAQLAELLSLICQVEEIYQKPVDIEWAFAGDQLYLLQARPITAFFALPPAYRTEPGQPKKLYADLTQSKWGMHEPLTILGTDFLRLLNVKALQLLLGDSIDEEAAKAIRPTHDGRTYINLSNSIKLQGKKRVVAEFREMDTIAADIIDDLDVNPYLPDKPPPALRGLMLKAVWHNLGTAWQSLQAIRHPDEIKRKYLEAEKTVWELYENSFSNLQFSSLNAFADETVNYLMDYMRTFTQLFAAALYARYRMKRIFKNDPAHIQAHLPHLEQSLPNNITIAMGLEMYRLASFPDIANCESGDDFSARLKAREFSTAFLAAWDGFMKKYGFRCPMEMDVGVQRFYEQPAAFFSQLQTLAMTIGDSNNPQAVFERAQAEREKAYSVLYEAALAKSKRKAKKFAGYYHNWIMLGGFRESPKYFLIMITNLLRQRIVAIAQKLVGDGRLDNIQQIFDLHMDEADAALVNPIWDLRRMAEENTRFLNQLKRSPSLPQIVDSRGRIYRSTININDAGDLVGQAVSPGVAQGSVKVLRRPDEKPVLPGDILVTKATDPGWTPLFLNASAVVLEVGGMLQPAIDG